MLTDIKTEDLEREAEEILRSPELLHYIKRVLDEKIVGEDKTKLLLFLVALSSRMEDDEVSLGAVVVGESGAGKSYMVKNITSLFPQEDILWFSRVTDAALNYLDTRTLTGKILVIEELEGIGDNPQLRVMLSEHGLKLLTTEKEDGQFKSKMISVRGSPAFFTCTTRSVIEDQLATRTFKVSPDESEEQTERVLQYIANKVSNIFEVFGEQKTYEEEVVKLLIRKLKPMKVYIPYASELVKMFPKKLVRARRDFSKLVNIIRIIAWLHQYQRTIVKIKVNEITENVIKTVSSTEELKDPEEKYILASPVDLQYALELVSDVFHETFTGVVPRAKELFEKIKDREYVTCPELAQEFDMPSRTVRSYLANLSQAGLLIKDDSTRPHRYLVRSEVNDAVFNGITIEELSYNEKEFLNGLKYERQNGKLTIEEHESHYVPLLPCRFADDNQSKDNASFEENDNKEAVEPFNTEPSSSFKENKAVRKVFCGTCNKVFELEVEKDAIISTLRCPYCNEYSLVEYVEFGGE